MDFKLEIDFSAYQKTLSELARTKIPGAVASAMNATVFGAREAVQARMQQTFAGGVSPYLKRGIRYRSAKPDDLSAAVYVNDDSANGGLSPHDILTPQVLGGPRGVKSSERRLRGWQGGDLLRPGQFITPGPGAPRDSRGNISGGQMQRILGYVRGFREKGYNVTKKTNKHFIIPGKGVFKHSGAGIVPVLFFSKAPQYKKRLDFQETFAAHVKSKFFSYLAERWGSAMLKAGYRG